MSPGNYDSGVYAAIRVLLVGTIVLAGIVVIWSVYHLLVGAV